MKVKKREGWYREIGEFNGLEVSILLFEIEISEVVQGNYEQLYVIDYILTKM